LAKVQTTGYLQTTDMPSVDIVFLLGYQELNSFLRAFNVWTGMSVTEYRSSKGQSFER